MLNVRTNRLNYGELLAPPSGYELTKAIGTTYSLDLYALLAIPIALFYAKSMEGTFQHSRYDVLDSIRQSEKKIDLFCQKGKIAVPEKYNDLLAFMEGAIIEVLPPNAMYSFHPKIWVLRFESEESVFYRLAVLSRNLTFDRSWDIVCFAEGKPSKVKNSESKKLSDYLHFFYDRTNRPKDLNLLKELSTVEFDYPDFFDSIELHPILGFNKQLSKFPNPILEEAYREMLIISPFLDEGTLKAFQEVNKKTYLVSRKEELDKIDSTILKDFDDVFCLNALVVEGEHRLDTEGDEALSQNLHAKIFIGSNNKSSDWYIGSANCSDPAFTRNAEFMLKLHSNDDKGTVAYIREELLSDKQTLFQRYTPSSLEQVKEEGEENIDTKLRRLHFHLAKIKFNGQVISNKINKNYDIQINTEIEACPYDHFIIKASLIHRKEELVDMFFGEPNSIIFQNIALTNLSKFLVLHIYYKKEWKGSLLVKMDIEMPSDREDAIFHNLINSKLKFFQYLQFLLSPSQFNSALEILDISEAQLKGEKLNQTSPLGFISNSPIYEYLMIAASRTPKKLKEIDKIIQRLEKMNSEVVEDFLPIWNVFKEFVHE